MLQSFGSHEQLSGPGRGGVYPERIPEVDPDFVLPVYKAQGKGVFWYNSVITGYMFRLVPALAERVELEMARLGLVDVPFVGAQVGLRVLRGGGGSGGEGVKYPSMPCRGERFGARTASPPDPESAPTIAENTADTHTP